MTRKTCVLFNDLHSCAKTKGEERGGRMGPVGFHKYLLSYLFLLIACSGVYIIHFANINREWEHVKHV